MYIFFMVAGFIFTIGLSIVLNYLYSIFSINKITKFLHPTDETIFNQISIPIIPIILWSFIELPILGNNNFFLVGLVLNIFLTSSIMYIIKYGYKLISPKESNIVSIIAILVSTFFGFIINYLSLLIGKDGDLLNSIIGLLVITAFYIVIKIFPPKSEFFRGASE